MSTCLKKLKKTSKNKNVKKKQQQKRKNNIFEYINNDAKKISDKVTLGDTLNPYEDALRSTAIDRTASNYNDAKEKVQKIRDLISTGRYDKDLAKYIPGLLELAFQGLLKDI